MSFLAKIIDERFLEHRRRSTSVAGMACAALAFVLFAYRYYVGHQWSWDLLAVGCTFIAMKLALIAWYRLTD